MSDPLIKSVSEIPTGKQLSHHQPSGTQLWDYSHTLNPDARKQYKLFVKVQPKLKAIDVHVRDVKGNTIGQWTGNWNIGRNIELHPHETVVDEEHRRKGLGLSMYEAAYSHAKNILGATHVVGGVHSTSAHLLHEKIAKKHGMEYDAKANYENPDGSKMTRNEWASPEGSGDYDGRFKGYKYLLKDEPVTYHNPPSAFDPTLPLTLHGEGFTAHVVHRPDSMTAAVSHNGRHVGWINMDRTGVKEQWVDGPPTRAGLKHTVLNLMKLHAKNHAPSSGWTELLGGSLEKSEPLAKMAQTHLHNTPEFKKWFGQSKAVDEVGAPKQLYHGTTHTFSSFSNKKANKENFLGQAHYFTDSPEDVGENYAGEGPDLKNRIEQSVERETSYMDDKFDSYEYTIKSEGNLGKYEPLDEVRS